MKEVIRSDGDAAADNACKAMPKVLPEVNKKIKIGNNCGAGIKACYITFEYNNNLYISFNGPYDEVKEITNVMNWKKKKIKTARAIFPV